MDVAFTHWQVCSYEMVRVLKYAADMQLQIYEDADNARREEITSLKGEDPMQ